MIQRILMLAAEKPGEGVGEYALALDLLIILAVAAAVTMLLKRLRLATIPGYVIAGALVGPYALGLVSDIESVESISKLAILLLMFTIGLHLDLNAVRIGMAHILILGAGTTVVSALVGWGVGVVAGAPAPAALTIGMALAMSSTAVVLKVLQQRRQMHSMHGRITFGILIVQDMLALVVLALLPPIALWAGAHGPHAAGAAGGDGIPAPFKLVSSVLVGLGGIVALIAFGVKLLPKLLQEAAKDAQAETLLVLSAAVALGAGAATEYLGFSAELGAFLAGFLLASTPFRYQLAGQLAPMRDLFMAVFFTAVGLKLNSAELLSHWQTLALALPLLILVKSVVIGGGTWLAGATAPTSMITGVGLAQGSEFSLVVIAVAGTQGILDKELTGEAIALTVISLALAPSLYGLAEKWQSRLAKVPAAGWLTNSPLKAEVGATHDGLKDHVIIAGFGVVGRNLAEHLAAEKIPYSIVELNPATVARQRKLGRSIMFGDVANPEVLETAGIHRADAVILTIPDDEATLRACKAIRELAPKVFIAARTSFLSRAIAATEVGADHVTIEEVATAQDMARQVVTKVRWIKEKREGEENRDASGSNGTEAPPSEPLVSG